MKTKLIIVLAVGVASATLASWRDVPLENVIRQSHVVVIGEITSIAEADPPEKESERLFDVADIAVQDVILNTLTNRTIKAEQHIPLAMPSIRNARRRSTDIRYKIGQQGIWILEFKNNAFWATYPKNFQPMSAEQEVRAIVRKLNEASSG